MKKLILTAVTLVTLSAPQFQAVTANASLNGYTCMLCSIPTTPKITPCVYDPRVGRTVCR